MELKTIFTIFHIFGAVIGAGGAFAGDYIFFQSVRDGKITKTEMGFIRNSSKMVWLGVFILLLSGMGLFLGNPSGYLNSSKFITKMIIVLIIIINGIIFHVSHIPRLQKCVGGNLKNNSLFKNKRNLFILSGTVSVISWGTTLILGVLRSIPYSVILALSVYLGIVIISFFVAGLITRKYI